MESMATLRIVCYSAPEDKKLMESLRAHLRVLEIQRVSIWYAQPTLPGTNWRHEYDSRLQSAHLILFLLSSDFLGSHELYQSIVLPAMERNQRAKTRVAPIILRPVHWQETLLGNLQPLPENGKPVTDPGWKTQDHAFVDVVHGIKRVINDEEFVLSVQQEHDASPLPDKEEEDVFADSDGVVQLEQIIERFKSLRRQIASVASLKIPQEFSIENCESQYNRLYGDAMVLLATYLPQMVSGDEGGFVETVYRKTETQLQKRTDIAVWLTRRIITPLAVLEKLAAQIDACVATLELYRQNHLTGCQSSSTL